jgi:hypothetical protein
MSEIDPHRDVLLRVLMQIVSFLVTPELKAKSKTLKDAEFRLYDNKVVCFQVLDEPEYLGKSLPLVPAESDFSLTLLVIRR